MWDIVESNIRVIRVPKEEEKENGAEAIFEEVMMEDFLKLIKDAVKKKKFDSILGNFQALSLPFTFSPHLWASQ